MCTIVDLPSVLERGEEKEHTPPPLEPQNEEFLHKEKKRELQISFIYSTAHEEI